MKLIERNTCAVTGSKDLESLYTFKKFPVFMGCTAEPEDCDIKIDMEWGISKSSGLIQLLKLLPLDLVYQASHGSGSTGSTWLRHHQAFADFIYNFAPNSVLEIGGGHGILAKNYRKHINWTILEPNPSPVEGTPAKYVRGYFNSNFKFDGAFDALVHSHVFEHIYNSNDFMKLLSSFIPEDKYLLFSIPNLHSWFKQKFTNAIGFEHTILLTEPYIDYLLAHNGFRLIDKQYFEEHSIFYAAVRDSKVLETELSCALYNKNKETFYEYIKYYEDLIKNLNSKMTGENIYIFGAHIFTQFLVNMGLNIRNICCVLDNDTQKQSKRLYGTSLKVASPKILKDLVKPIVILKAGSYTNEIKHDILTNINPETIFWE